MAMEDRPTFGDLLRSYRGAAGLTQEALAEQARLSARAISDLERDVKHTPRPTTVQLLAQALRLAGAERAAFMAAASRPDPLPSRISRPSGIAPHAPWPGQALPAHPTQPPLLGRAGELALLERHLAVDGPPALVLAGEPGVGKSRLLDAVTERAANLGWRVLAAGCQRRGGQTLYAPLLEALHTFLQGLEPMRQRAVLKGCSWTVRLLPELVEVVREPMPAWSLPPEQERRLMFAAVGRFLSNVAGPSGTLLALDDLQWAGIDALDLLVTLVRTPGPAPLRVVGAYRDTDVTPTDPLAIALADLAHARLVRRHALPPLREADARRLLDGLLEGRPTVGEALREQVVRRTGGVPFFVVSCAQDLGLDTPADETVAALGEGMALVPWDVAQGIRQRVAALPEVTQAVLGVAAVAGREASAALLVEASGEPEQTVYGALEAASRARLLVEAGQGAYRFAHDVIWEVVAFDVGAARRLALHRHVAEALERIEEPAPVELLAYHYSRGEASEQAVRYLEQAGDRAREQAAHGAAEGYYRELTERLERLGRTLEVAAAREKLGTMLRTMARYDEALETLDAAAATYRARAEREPEARVMAQVGHVYTSLGRVDDGLRRLEAVRERLDVGEPRAGVAALYTALAHLYDLDDRFTEAHQAALRAAERAGALARVVGDKRILADAETMRGIILFQLGRGGEAVLALEEAVRLAEAAADAEILWNAVLHMINIKAIPGDFDAAAPYMERLLPLAERLGDPEKIMRALAGYGSFAFLSGRWSEARAYYERALRVGREGASASWSFRRALQHLGELSLCEGAWEDGAGYLNEALALARQSGDQSQVRVIGELLVERDLLLGRPGVARDWLIAQLGPLGQTDRSVTRLLRLLAWARLDLGDIEAAGETAERAAAWSRIETNGFQFAYTLWVWARVLVRQQRWTEAERVLDEGLALARARYPYCEGLLLHVYGLLHGAKGEPAAARARLEEALTIFRHVGARAHAGWAAQDLAALPAAPQPASDP